MGILWNKSWLKLTKTSKRFMVGQSIIKGFLKNIGQAYNLSLTAVVQLEQDDEIQLVVSADSACTLTFYNVITTIRPFKV